MQTTQHTRMIYHASQKLILNFHATPFIPPTVSKDNWPSFLLTCPCGRMIWTEAPSLVLLIEWVKMQIARTTCNWTHDHSIINWTHHESIHQQLDTPTIYHELDSPSIHHHQSFNYSVHQSIALSPMVLTSSTHTTQTLHEQGHVHFKYDKTIYLFIYCWLIVIAQSTAQGHLRAFHKFKFCIQVKYNTKHAHYINVKHINIIRKVVPSVSLS